MNLKTIQLLNNNVLLKPRMNNDRIVFSSGKELYIDCSFEPEIHANIVADVIAVPENVLLRQGNLYIDEDQVIPVEILPGDVAYCYYLAIRNALTRKFDGKAFVENKELYCIISYENIFMVLRDGKPIMVNDYVLIEPTYREFYDAKARFDKIGLEFPLSEKDKYLQNTQYGIIRYIGQNLSPENGFTDEQLYVGREVIITKNADIPLEVELHQTFEKGKKLFRVKRKDIVMVLEG
jgi:hypothetical protein